MALVPCSECGRQISTRAAACPGCGCPTPKAEAEESTSLLVRAGVGLLMGDYAGAVEVGRRMFFNDADTSTSPAMPAEEEDAAHDVEPPCVQLYVVAEEFPSHEIDQLWLQDQSPFLLAHSPDGWFLATLHDAKLELASKYVVQAGDDFPFAWIEARWSEGLRVTSIFWGEGHWVVTVGSLAREEGERIVHTADFPEDELDAAWAGSERIASVAYSPDHGWAMLFEAGDHEQRCQFSRNPGEDISAAWQEGLAVQCVAHTEAGWFIVFQGIDDDSPFADQVTVLADTESFPMETLEAHGAEGWLLTSVAYGEGQWLLVLSRLAGDDGDAP